MNFRVYTMLQRSPAWFSVRIGLLTGSAAGALIATRKKGSGELQKRVDLRRRLICERITGLPIGDSTYRSPAMQRGMDLEPLAFAAYEAATGLVAHRVGFVQHPELRAGCSPDGYIGTWDGLIELKCPDCVTHLEYLQSGGVPEAYRGQMLHALWLTGARWCDFVSYDTRFPPHLQLFRVRARRDDFEVMTYDRTVREFLLEVDAEVAALAPASLATA